MWQSWSIRSCHDVAVGPSAYSSRGIGSLQSGSSGFTSVVVPKAALLERLPFCGCGRISQHGHCEKVQRLLL
eukprot:gene18760-biopygen9977